MQQLDFTYLDIAPIELFGLHLDVDDLFSDQEPCVCDRRTHVLPSTLYHYM